MGTRSRSVRAKNAPRPRPRPRPQRDGSGRGRIKAAAQRRRWLIALTLLAAAAGGVAVWWKLTRWRPPITEFPVQGAWLPGGADTIRPAALKAIGARFVYLPATRGADRHDRGFSLALAEAQAAGLTAGAVHLYDPCEPADTQSANFVTVVPRDETLLPPAVALSATGEDCPRPVLGARVESELVTFLNQIEMHAGKSAILMLSPEFEERYGIGWRSDRSLWLTRDWLQPDYAGRPWGLWTANRRFRNDAASQPFGWVVAQP